MKKAALTFLLLFPILLMAQTKPTVTKEFLQSFADAFNAHDTRAIMLHMTEDCVFEASAGPDADGEKFIGQEQVRKAFENVFTVFPDAKWSNATHFISGDRGCSEWIFTGTKTDGTRVEVTGCDLFTFENGKIAIKNSYRKNRLQPK
jgi:ketosteroid isomerase-like protein